MKKILSIVALIALLTTCMFSQNVTSSVKGTVVDPNGALIPGATCQLANRATGSSLEVQSDANGLFTFLNVLAGDYTLRIEAKGFKPAEMALNISASQIRTVGDIKLTIGAGSETVTVTDEAAQIQLASAEKSGTISANQLENLAVKGRDVFTVLSVIPGVVDNGTAQRVISAPTQVGGTVINGGRDSQKNFTVDGITNLDTGSNQTTHYTTTPDSIQEIRVLTSNYQAEYGRSAGGAITVITKSGTQNFHGTGYYYGRNESLNATSWDAHHYKYPIPKSVERAGIKGFSLGGPIFIPDKFNSKKDKLFFFVSEEWSHWKQPASTKVVTVPTLAERNGDFSQSRDSSGALITVIDPLTHAQFPGNIIPTDRISQMGQDILKFFPEPNYTNPQGAYLGNYISQYSGNYNRRSDMFRIDANITPTLSAYFRFNNDMDEQNQPWGNWVTSMNWVLSDISFNQPGHGYNLHVTKVFSPTLVNDFAFGKSYNHLTAFPSDASKWQRSQLGIPDWYGNADYLPNIAFGSRHYTPANISVIGSFPYDNWNDIYTIVDNLSMVRGKHNLKFGFYFERDGKVSPLWSTYRGTLSFGHSALNPISANDGFANAMLGIVNSFQQSTQGGSGDWWFNNLEWYVQDNWKLTSRLTLDAGLRFYHMGPVVDYSNKMSTFNPALYDRTKAPRLYQPVMQGGNRVGYDAVTNTYVPRVAIGAMVPNSGDFNNGSCAAGQNGCPEGLAEYSAIDVGPRIGLAYDVFGNGKTALHFGGGIFKDRGSILPPVYATGSAPIGYTSTAYYTTLDQLSGATGYRFPNGGFWTSGAWAFYGRLKTPTTTSYSFGIQQELPQNVVVDVSYVGNISRHIWINKDINPIPVGARFNPANADPTTGGVLPDDFFRTYPGYTDVTAQLYDGTANYNALQVKADRRFRNGFQIGAAYTWSRTLGVASGDGEAVSSYLNPRDYNYGPTGYDRTHSLVFNYWYELPKLGKATGNSVLGYFTDDWSVSGITSFISGSPVTPSVYWNDGRDVTGSTDGARGDIIGDPFANIPAGMQFNPAAFRATPKGTYGNVSFGTIRPGVLRGPGINNWDMTLSKRVPLGNERRYLQFKAEAFNVFNHTQYKSFNSSVAFDATNNPILVKDTGGNYVTGAYNAAREPRKLQYSVKLFF
ncbi:MAG TPA: carboxypeptidase regulatory-like domain-containing protein [Terriglobales bacterium]|nr:carboxypeptidase regulatory-like domain-containing protein [Terriglobales bacterium]